MPATPIFLIQDGLVRLADQPTDARCNQPAPNVRFIRSPFFNERPHCSTKRDPRSCAHDTKPLINTIVIHNISLPPNEFGKHDAYGNHYVTALFTGQLNPDDHPYFASIQGLEVSAHFFILRDGALIQYVNCDDRAWHAGKSRYLGRDAVNDFSIGIELEGSDDTPFLDSQYHTLSHLIVALYDAYPDTFSHLTGHSDIAPMRKTDPGAHFDWQRLRRMIQALLTKAHTYQANT